MPVRIPGPKPRIENDPLEEFWDNMVDAIMDVPIRILIGIIGIVPVFGQPIANALGEWLLDTNEKAVAANEGVETISKGIFDGWFGGDTGVGDPLEVQYTIESMRDVVTNGATVETKTSSGTWTKPAGIVELTVILISAGHNGANGTVAGSSTLGGVGGWGGSFRAQVLDPALLPETIAYTVGANGAATTFGDISVQTPVGGPQNAARGDMISFSEATPSLPGARGGTGGRGGASGGTDPTAGTAGSASLLAAGGAGGAGKQNGNGTPGVAGSNVSLTAATKCGGSAGGGGGGASTGTFGDYYGGPGGPGGYPGGPGGGGGTIYNGNPITANAFAGAGGLGAHGVIWIIHKSPTIPEAP